MRILDVLDNATRNLQSDEPLDVAIGKKQVEVAVKFLQQGHPIDANVYEIEDEQTATKDEQTTTTTDRTVTH